MNFDLKSSYYNVYTFENDKFFVFNTLTKAKIEVTEKLFNALKYEKYNDIDDTFVESLKENGFLVDKCVDEFSILKEAYQKVRGSKDTLILTVVPTFMCNFRCSYCFEGSDSKNNTCVIDYDVMKKYALNVFPKYKHVHISLFGGEPLLTHKKNIDYLQYVDELSKKHNFTYSTGITTNGYLMTDSIMEELIKYHCESYQITIDGCKETHNSLRKLVNGNGTYDDVISNFKKMLRFNDKSNLNIMLRVNLLNNSQDEITSLLSEFTDEEKNKFSIYFRSIYNTAEFKEKNDNENELSIFYTLAEKYNFNINIYNYFSFYHCEGDGDDEQFHIMPDLKVYKCTNDLGMNQAYLGTIDSNGNLEFNDNLNFWRNGNNVFEDEKCKICKFLPMCWGGCPLRYKKSGKRLCIREKKIMEDLERKEDSYA